MTGTCTSSLQQTSSVEDLTPSSGEAQMTETCTSSLQQISDDEFSDNTVYEDIDYVPDSTGYSSDTSVHSSSTETSGDPSLTPDSTTLSNMEPTLDPVMLDCLESTSRKTSTESTDSQQNTAPKASTASLKFSNKKKAGKGRSKWRDEEVTAVERHLLPFITDFKVPGKRDCEACLQAEPVALKDRDWAAVKFYIYNRVVALKRRLNK
ncbi:flocculation protein FLO11 isoform X5 [Oryzias melastigma]|uniref:flocculation protein FLO11 isoform X5 n=1 Tax=Oryzias melastigma TaxID=30732 RepID=UPI000CF7EB9E|nr:flocculation protein FLO11 isoform X5 [Oryzias melastigma]